jgi:hypothetical protein
MWIFPYKSQLSNIKAPELPESVTPTSKTVWWRQVPGVCSQKFTPKKNRNQKKLDGKG